MSKYEIKESGTLVYYMFDKKTGERGHPSKEESDDYDIISEV